MISYNIIKFASIFYTIFCENCFVQNIFTKELVAISWKKNHNKICIYFQRKKIQSKNDRKYVFFLVMYIVTTKL